MQHNNNNSNTGGKQPGEMQAGRVVRLKKKWHTAKDRKAVNGPASELPVHGGEGTLV